MDPKDTLSALQFQPKTPLSYIFTTRFPFPFPTNQYTPAGNLPRDNTRRPISISPHSTHFPTSRPHTSTMRNASKACSSPSTTNASRTGFGYNRTSPKGRPAVNPVATDPVEKVQAICPENAGMKLKSPSK